MFEKKSRYENVDVYEVTDARGRRVKVVAVPSSPKQRRRGIHIRQPGQRLDHLAAKYLDDFAGYWRIVEEADQMLPEALTEAQDIPIPWSRT